MKLKRKEYLTEQEKKSDRWLGFGFWWGLNILLTLLFVTTGWLSATGDWPEAAGLLAGIALNLLPLAVNIVVVIYLALTRPQMALGMLLGFASAFALTLILGIVLTVACFVALGSAAN